MSIESQNTPETIEQWFEKEFKKRETIDTPDGPIEILDITPREIKHATPVLFISGYGDGSPEGRKANILELTKQGRRVIVVKSPHGIGNGAEKEESKELPESILRQVNAMMLSLEKKAIGKISVLGESRGGSVALALAYLFPEKFENLILVDSGGLVPRINGALLATRFIKTGMSEGAIYKKREDKGEVSELNKEQVRWGTQNFVKWVLATPLLSAKEISDIGKVETYKFLHNIKNHGIGISVIHGVDDKVFPMKDIQETISKQKKSDTEEETEISKIIDGFYSVKGNHGEFNTQPEKYTRVAIETLTALEEKQKKSL